MTARQSLLDWRGGALAALLAATCLQAQAQVQEVVVTAQRRGEEALQDVPLAVSAFGADRLESLQIDVVKDIGQNVPNLQTYTVTAGAQAIQVHSRGASVQNPGFNLSESPVGIYIDEVYFGRLASANLDLTDIERIEVLRGPQGTLYGRNTIAGAIKVVTRTPDDESWRNFSVGYGNYDTFKVTGSFGGPIEQGALAGSISFLYDDRNEGWQNNPATGGEPGEYENKAVRAKLHWYGTSGFDAVLTGWAVDGENDGFNAVPYTPFENDGPSADFDPAPPGSRPIGGFYDNFDPEGVNYGSTDQAGVNLTMSLDLGGITLRSITGYADIEDEFGFDLAGGGAGGFAGTPGLLISSDAELNQFSQEFQLLGSIGESIDWQLGLFYLNEDGEQLFSGGFRPPLTDPPVSLPAQAFAEFIQSETDSYAVFTEGTWQATQALSITAGARWTKDKKEYTDDCVGAFCFDGVSPPGMASVDLKEDWDEFTFKLGADYKVNEDHLVYASWSQGYQSGAFRTLCFGNLSVGCGGEAFDPQTVDSFELGWKADYFDNTLRVNTALFYAMYDDIQQIVSNNAGGFPIDNIGEVDVYGIELEVTWSPIANLNVFATLGIQESDYGDVDPLSPPGGFGVPCGSNPPPCANPVDELPSNPNWQGKLGFDYTIDLGNNLAFFYGADVFHSDDYFSEARALVKIDSYTRVNGFIGIGEADKRWQVVLTGKNITDEEDNVSGIFAQGFTNMRTVLPPAEYMLTFRMNY